MALAWPGFVVLQAGPPNSVAARGGSKSWRGNAKIQPDQIAECLWGEGFQNGQRGSCAFCIPMPSDSCFSPHFRYSGDVPWKVEETGTKTVGSLGSRVALIARHGSSVPIRSESVLRERCCSDGEPCIDLDAAEP